MYPFKFENSVMNSEDTVKIASEAIYSGSSLFSNMGFVVFCGIRIKFANSVDLDEAAHKELLHLALHCLSTMM